MSDPHKLAAMRLIQAAGSAAYIAAPTQLAPLFVFKAVSLSVRHGNTASSAFLYAVYGQILCGVVGDIDAGYRFGRLALNLLDRLDADEFRARTLMVVHHFVSH